MCICLNLPHQNHVDTLYAFSIEMIQQGLENIQERYWSKRALDIQISHLIICQNCWLDLNAVTYQIF